MSLSNAQRNENLALGQGGSTGKKTKIGGVEIDHELYK